MQVIECLFFIAVFAIVYTYVLYPIVLFILSAAVQLFRDGRFVIGKTDRRVQNGFSVQQEKLQDVDTTQPSIGVIIAAYNEEKSIQERIENLLSQSYPQDRINIYIGSDGSDDRTIEIANTFEASNLNIFDFQERRGKVSVLNELVETASEDILVFSDANTMFAIDAISSK